MGNWMKKNRTIAAAFTAGLVMTVAASMGVFAEGVVRFLLPIMNMPGIDPQSAGMIAVLVAVFATVTAVLRAMTDDI